mgnify:CR=1 FL=1
MNKEFKRMQELAGVSLNEQMEDAVGKWLDGLMVVKSSDTVLTSKDDYKKYGSQKDPNKVSYVIDGEFKPGMLNVRYAMDGKYIHIPLKDIRDLAKKLGVEDSNYYQVEDAVKDVLKKKGYKQELATSFDRSGFKVGEMQSQFFQDPNLNKTNESESLNEHYVAGGIVGIGAINQIPPREKSDYEMAFEHFMTEGEEKEEKKEISEDEIEEAGFEPNIGDGDEGFGDMNYRMEEGEEVEEAVGIPAEASAIRDAVRKMMKDHSNDADLGAAVRKKFAK